MSVKIIELSPREKLVLRKMVEFTCEQCGKHEDEVGTLEIHRLKRGNVGGEYVLRNVKVLCKWCHSMYHYDEPGIGR